MIDDKFDYVIVGTGFASTFFLKKLLDRSKGNLRIAVLERGQLYAHSQRLEVMRSSISEYEKISRGYSTYQTDSDKPWLFDPNFGGSSNCWVGCTPRFMPEDFALKSKYGVGNDWPITYEQLESYYCEAEEMMGIAGPSVTPFPKSKPYPQIAHKLTEVDKLIQKKYGERYISQPSARSSEPSPSRGVCCSTGVCSLCPVSAKFTIENSYTSLFHDSQVHLIYGAQVLSFQSTNNVVTRVNYLKGDREVSLKTENLVLGANALFNAHILLNSGDTNKFTGRGIGEQVGAFVRIYYDGINSVGGSSIVSANGYMMYEGEHRKEYAAALIESWNTPFIRNEEGKWRQMSLFKFIFEDLPMDENRIVKTEDRAIPKIIYNGFSSYAQRGLDNLKMNVEKYFGFLPIERIEYDEHSQKTEGHICGTTRMSKSPEDGVIDENMIHHHYRNLVVLGSGSYPTCTPSNPTLTLSALSLRAAEKYLS